VLGAFYRHIIATPMSNVEFAIPSTRKKQMFDNSIVVLMTNELLVTDQFGVTFEFELESDDVSPLCCETTTQTRHKHSHSINMQETIARRGRPMCNLFKK